MKNQKAMANLKDIRSFPEAARKGQAAQQLVSRAYPRRKVMYNGVELTLYSVSWLAHLCGKSPKSIVAWERKGLFPKPLLKVDAYRWYTAAELTGYARIVKSAALRRGRYTGGAKQTDWLKQNAYMFKNRLKEYIEHNIGKVPTRHPMEDEFIQDLSKQQRIKFTPEQIARMIKP